MPWINKKTFISTLACPTLGWLSRTKDIVGDTLRREPTLGEKFRIEQGIEIGNRARSYYPGGLLIDEKSMASACAATNSAIDDKNISIICEAAFLKDDFAVRADILKREGSRWHVIEVKSSVNDKKEFIDDMAYTAMVLARCGLDICAVSLLLISRDFRVGMDNQQLFMEIDHTDEVLLRAGEFEQQWQLVKDTTSASQIPEPQLKFICRRCPLFGECLGKDIDNHIFDIPRLSESKFDKLTQSGIVCIEDIPTSFPLTANQTIVCDSVREKEAFIGDALTAELGKIVWPTHYLDFESLMTAIPLFPDVAPYTQIPTQYSIHRCTDIGDITDHFEYMADPTRDCRLELAQNLIDHLQGEGNIIVYSNFEKTIIRNLANLCEELATQLNSLLDRTIDLQAIINKNFYDPDFHGSTSIKSVLPILVSDLSYENLSIVEGGSAMAAFAYLALGRYKDEEAETVRSNLLDYCKQDTLAMVKLHERLTEFV